MRSKLPYIILIVAFVGYVLLEVLGPQPMNWSPSYEKTADRPFGSYILYESLPDLFPGQTITVVEESPKKVLAEFEKEKSNYLIIQDELDTDQFEAKALIDYVKRGNCVFIAASVYQGSLADSLNIENTETLWDLLDKEPAEKDYLQFEEEFDETVKHYPLLDKVVYNNIPIWTDAETLGTNKNGRRTFIRIPRGEGYFYIHSIPLMFTNYFMVDPVNHEYIAKAISFLPNRPVIWDEYFKPGKVRTNSPVKYLLEERALTWAWIVLLSTVFVFLFFEGKRRQRIVPVIDAPANTTLEFTRTVGRLYYSHGDHKDIAEKKIKFLLEYIRNRWMLPTNEYSEDFLRKLSAKSGVPITHVQELFAQAQGIHRADEISAASLTNLNQAIDHFYQTSK